jgi:hypothetical protein
VRHIMPHGIVHWSPSWITDATLDGLTIPRLGSATGDTVDLDNVYMCLVTVTIDTPAGCPLDRVYYISQGDVDGAHYCDPWRVVDSTDPSRHRPIGEPGEVSHGPIVRKQLRVYGEELPRFRHMLIHDAFNKYVDADYPIVVTLTYKIAVKTNV